jgi:type IV secretory pathway TraG/TraD family ATPase VirD4
MSQIEFEEGSQAHLRRIDISNASSHNTPLLIKWGFAKNTFQANIIMLVVTVVCIATAITLFVMNAQNGETLYREDFTEDEINRMLPNMRDNLPSRK